MSIISLAGNFQPLPNSNGNSLPQNLNNESAVSNSQLKISPKLVDVKQSNQLPPSPVNVPENNKQEVQNEIKKLQQFNQSIERSLQFKIDDELGVTIVRVVDRDTDELIRQFPSEELISLSKRLKEFNEQSTNNIGIILQEKV